MKKITIPGSVINIGDEAFENCTSLASLTICSGVKKIGMHAFDYCTSLQTVTIPGSVKTICVNAFFGCSNLKKITLSLGLEEIGTCAFAKTAITSITIPETVTNLHSDALGGCPNLKDVSMTKELYDKCGKDAFMDSDSFPFESGIHILKENPMTVKGKTAKVKYKKVRKKTRTVAVSKVLNITKGTGPYLFVKLSGKKKITINKTTGKVTVKKKLKKGTYKVKVKVMSKGNATYKASSWKTVTFKIKVK